jgi:CheY-like chemotaxis protein
MSLTLSILQTILCRQLKASNCITESAINGAEAVDLVMKAGDNRFDCILMDCEMVSGVSWMLVIPIFISGSRLCQDWMLRASFDD